MSTLYEVEVACAACAHIQRALLADSLNVARKPEIHQWVLDGTLHRVVCDRCGHAVHHEKPLFYADFDRGLFIQVFQTASRWFLAESEAVVVELYRRVFSEERAPAVVRAMAAGLRPQVVFGYAELREKVLCVEHGLDDFVLEAVKISLLASTPRLAGDGVEGLLLVAVHPDGSLELVPRRRPHPVEPLPEGARPTSFAVPKAAWEHALGMREVLVADLPDLESAVYRNMLRYRYQPSSLTASERSALGMSERPAVQA